MSGPFVSLTHVTGTRSSHLPLPHSHSVSSHPYTHACGQRVPEERLEGFQQVSRQRLPCPQQVSYGAKCFPVFSHLILTTSELRHYHSPHFGDEGTGHGGPLSKQGQGGEARCGPTNDPGWMQSTGHLTKVTQSLLIT